MKGLVDSVSYGFTEGTTKEAHNDLEARVNVIEDDLFYPYEGGTVQAEIIPANRRMFVIGALTGEKKVLQFTVPCGDLSAAASITVNAFRANIRHVAGGYIGANAYISGGYDFSANYTVTAQAGTDHCVEIRVTSGTAFDVAAANNTPISVEVNALIVTLSNDAG